MHIIFRNQEVYLNFAPYIYSKNTALEIINKYSKENIAIITANIKAKIPKDILLIVYDKNETSDIQALIDSNVIQSDIIATYEHESMTIHAYRLTDSANEIRLKQYSKFRYEEILL